MSLAGRIIDVAVAISPAADRTTRAEQWRADVRDSRELDLSPTRLAFGALMTALLHPRGSRPSRGLVRAMPSRPHMFRTASMLVGLAFVSLVLGAVSTLVLGRYNGSQWSLLIGVTAMALLCVVPGACMIGAVLFVDRTTPRRRVIGALLVVFLALRLGTVVIGLFRSGPDWAWVVLVATGVLATWFLVLGRRGLVWVLLALPPLTLAVLEPASVLLRQHLDLSSPEYWATVWTPVIGPFASALIAGIVSPRLDIRRSTEPTLVDRSV